MLAMLKEEVDFAHIDFNNIICSLKIVRSFNDRSTKEFYVTDLHQNLFYTEKQDELYRKILIRYQRMQETGIVIKAGLPSTQREQGHLLDELTHSFELAEQRVESPTQATSAAVSFFSSRTSKKKLQPSSTDRYQLDITAIKKGLPWRPGKQRRRAFLTAYFKELNKALQKDGTSSVTIELRESGPTNQYTLKDSDETILLSVTYKATLRDPQEKELKVDDGMTDLYTFHPQTELGIESILNVYIQPLIQQAIQKQQEDDRPQSRL